MLALFLTGPVFCQFQFPPINQHTPPNPTWNSEFLSTAVPLIQDASTDITRCKNNNDWGLSYDDGPGPYTPILLDALQQRNLKATFFVVGSQVMQYPDMLKRSYAAGHQIGIHTWSHPPLNTMSNEQIVAEVMYTATLIKQTIGIMPKFIRPPYGAIDARVRGVLARLGLTPVTWSNDTNDNSGADVLAEIRNFVTQKSGQIALEHDLLQNTATEAANALDIILQAGFSPKPVAACVGRSDWYGDIVGVKPPAPNPNPKPNPNPAPRPSITSSASPTPSPLVNNTLSIENATAIMGPTSSEGQSDIWEIIANSTLPELHITNATVYKEPTSSAKGVSVILALVGCFMLL